MRLITVTSITNLVLEVSFLISTLLSLISTLKLMYLLLKIVINLNIPAYPESGNVITGNLKIISDKRIHAIVSKGPHTN